MDTIRTTSDKADSASQKFTFFEKTIMIGTRFRIGK